MSILAEVLTSIQEVSEEEIESKIPKLNEEIRTLLHETLSYSENVFVTYLESPVKHGNVIDSCQQIEKEIESLNNALKYATRKDLGKTPRKTTNDSIYILDEMHMKLGIISALAEINVMIIDFDDRLMLEDYLACKKITQNLDKYIEKVPKDDYDQLYCGILENIFDRKSLLDKHLRKTFHDCLSIKVDPDKNTSTLKVTKNIDNLQRILDAIAYDSLEKIHSLDNVIELLWEFFFLPILEKKAIHLESNEKIACYNLCIDTRYSSKQDEESDEKIFENLELLLKFLQTYLILNFGDKFTCLQYIGNYIQSRLDKKLMEFFLNSLQRLKTLCDFELIKPQMMDKIIKLDETLKQCQIFDDNKQLLQNYTKNIDLMYMKEKCSKYNAQALNIMKKDFFGYIQLNLPDKFDVNINQTLSVSRNVGDLMRFCESIMEEAVTSSSHLNAGMLFTTVQMIIKMYGRFIPKYHEKMFRADPLFVALFHNNCLYIESILTDWNERLCMKLPGCHSGSKFTIETHQLKCDASKVFVEFIENELKQLQNNMNDHFEKDIKVTEQCIQKFETLHSTWSNILPNNLANRSMGEIINSFCICIINSIINTEKLSTEELNTLRAITKMTLSRCLKLFTNTNEIEMYVKSWNKLSEINFILNANLLEIKHRWSNGDSTMAKLFKNKNSAEFNSLLRAIFWQSKDDARILSEIIGYV